MSEKKKTQAKAPAEKKKTTAKGTAKKAPVKKTTPKKAENKAKEKKETAKKPEIPRATAAEALGSDLLGLFLIALAILLAMYLYGKEPAAGLGKWVYWTMFNAVGAVAFFVPPFCLVMGFFAILGSRRTPAAGRVPVCIFLVFFIAAAIQTMGGVEYAAPVSGDSIAGTVQNFFTRVWECLQIFSEHALGMKNTSRGGGVLGGLICLILYWIGGKGLCYVGVWGGLITCVLLLFRISLKTFPDLIRVSVKEIIENIDPDDEEEEPQPVMPEEEEEPAVRKKKQDLFIEDMGEDSFACGHLTEVNRGMEKKKQKKAARAEAAASEGDELYDGFFNNEPIDDILPMERELSVTDLKHPPERKKQPKQVREPETVLFGSDETSFLRDAPIPEAFLKEPEAAAPEIPEAEAHPTAEVKKAAGPVLFDEEPAIQKATTPAMDDTTEEPEPDALSEADGADMHRSRYSAEELKEAFAAEAYTPAQAAKEAMPKAAPKLRPVDEVTGEPLPEVAEAPEEYTPFSLDCLNEPSGSNGKSGENPNEIGKKLVETLQSFGIETEFLEYSRGPVVTRYELRPATGVRVNKITALANDIALALAATRVRIEAPIPNKAAVGIEVPNKHSASVLLREILDSDTFRRSASSVSMAMGKDIGGKIVVADLAKMPHMLIAGSTGSGKSVCINNLILSMVYKSAPKDLRLILVDPKQVELSVYASLPHLLIPVVTDPKKASSALRWAVNEMTMRYTKFTQRGARDLIRYNSLQEEEKDRLPRIVVIVDELADLMMVCPDEVEDSICRIAQLGRAAGIHLIVATQRPSADVITGLIKANIPSRAAFAVSSAIDSRIILDAAGAEKLLGKGDCLFHPNGADKATRLQAAFVSDDEVEKIMEHYKGSKAPEYASSIEQDMSASGGAKGGVFGEGKQEDDLLGEAVRIVLDSGQASISMIQRKLRVGYARAARLVDMMEEKGYVSGFDGSKPRKVLIKRAEFDRIFGGGGMAAEEDEEDVPPFDMSSVPEEITSVHEIIG